MSAGQEEPPNMRVLRMVSRNFLLLDCGGGRWGGKQMFLSAKFLGGADGKMLGVLGVTCGGSELLGRGDS